MLTIILAGAAAALSVPSVTGAFSTGDYPEWALRSKASAASVIKVVVDPNGKIAQCINVREFGDRQLAKEVCRILSRKRLQSPTLRDGQKVHAFLETMIQIFLPDTIQGRQVMALRNTPDADLSVNKLPSGTSADVSVNLAFDPAGKITDCTRSEHEKEVALAEVACSQRTLFDNTIQNDLTGQPVAYVTRKRVRFTVAPKTK